MSHLHLIHRRNETQAATRCALALLFVAAICAIDFTAALAQESWEFAPYRVRACIVAVDPGEFSAAEIKQLEHSLTKRAAAHIGAGWRFEMMPAGDALRGELRTRFDELTSAKLLNVLPRAGEIDKLFLVQLARNEFGIELRVREFDATTLHLSDVAQREVVNRDELADELLLAIAAAFRPLVQFERAVGETISGKLRAGALLDDEQSPLTVTAGAALLPVLRIEDRLGQAGSSQISVLPLTVLEVVECDDERVSCKIHAAARHRLGSRASLRLSRYGLAVRPTQRSTRIVLQSNGANSAPLVDYDLIESDAAGPKLIASTNADGVAQIAADERPWRMLYVRHGEHLLARLPIVTGLEGEIVVPLANNDVRLRAEGFVAALTQEVVDTVARRQILTARLRQQIATGKYDDAQTSLAALQRLASSRDFQQRLQTARTTFVGDNARAQQHIDALFRATRDSLARYLDPSEIARLETQLAKARQQP